MNQSNYSVHSVHRALLETFHQYLSAQYHIWDESLISERDRIFAQVGNTYQEPRLEATPQYAEGNTYATLAIPKEAKDILNCAAGESGTGIPTIAYSHQCKAIENFTIGKDLIVATGTGSGKTESFLMPILCSLAVESANRPSSWSKHGVRAILLYPMNALVNDQLARLRRLLGNPVVKAALRGSNTRGAAFGMYTSRSPYPGQRTTRKDKIRVIGEINKLYFDGMTDDYRARLKAEGKWPAKDLEAFKESNLKTAATDAELITRHEMQDRAPDLLVTNYSMLEYMMLRPLEAPIFQQTAEWLAADKENQLTIVLDEAHMYRGSGGAEVAYLLRRLQSRLGVSRDRIRFILTSASLGSSDEAKVDIISFAAKLTGGTPSAFELITGEINQRTGGKQADAQTQRHLAAFDISPILSASTNIARAESALISLAKDLQISLDAPLVTLEGLQQYAFDILEHLPVASLISERLTKEPTTLTKCAKLAFPTEEGSLQAIESLLALMAFAKDCKKSRPFCPIRSHFFFRGLPGLFVCTNATCRTDRTPRPQLLGRLHPSETLRCECGSRVYELLTHRSCGASYLRAYVQGADGSFLWHQPSKGTWTERKLLESQFYVVPESELETAEGTLVWLHTPTGQLVSEPPIGAKTGHYLALLRPNTVTREHGRIVLSLSGDCPACDQRTRFDAPLAMDLATKGEAPFAHMIRTQVSVQPITQLQSPQAPNGGRKTIVFSDGRQKAARLARDIPREIELDVFRQTIFMAAQVLHDINRPARLNENLYVAFLKCLLVHNLRFFDGDDRVSVDNDLNSFVRFFDGDVEEQLKDSSLSPPPSYWAILLKQLGTPFYSVSALTLGYVAPSPKPIYPKILEELPHLAPAAVEAIAVMWIQRLLTRFSFGKDIPDGVRSQASRYPLKASVASDGFSRRQKDFLKSKDLDVDHITNCLARNLCETKPDGSLYLKPSHLILKPALDSSWVQCPQCKSVSPTLLFDCCSNCMSPNATLIIPDTTTYLRARKGFWREPVVKAMAGTIAPMNIDVQEHTAQLSYKDADNPSPTTEIFERRFRDILRMDERAVDVLSCTTTMEVGIDIGSLIAVSMRNVPPMRQNYQQRAGRSGRRGSAVSTVVTYAQSSAHDAYYFRNPDKILAGDPPKPVLDTSNTRISDRHLLAQLLQDFFRPLAASSHSGDIYTVLGDTWSFFHSNLPTALESFKRWVRNSADGRDSLARAQQWLPAGRDASQVAESMIAELEQVTPGSKDGLDSSFIEFLFSRGLLPSYAFPTDLCSFQIQEWAPGEGFHIVEQAQQGLNVALSEYAPGRLLVVNKKTYRIGTVAASGLDTDIDRAAALFDKSNVYRHCTECSYTAGFISGDDGERKCPQCAAEALRTMTVIRPEMVFPSGRREIDEYQDQVFSRVTQAQLPLPEADRKIQTESFGERAGLAPLRKQRLIVVNEGDPDSKEPGFCVCRKCGKVLAEGQMQGPHKRDYYTRPTGNPIPQLCDGKFEHVFLGYGFTSDVLLLRIDLAKPLRFGMLSRRNRKPMEDALLSLCEALTLSIGRVLDIDVSEVSAGYRFGSNSVSDFADIFIYDTLAGGAGYALQAGESFAEVFDSAKTLLTGCTCQASCENCLRHYSNRFTHADMDRHLGATLAQYLEEGIVPAQFSIEAQSLALAPLIEMIKLAGWNMSQEQDGIELSLNGRRFRLNACPSLRACDPMTLDSDGVTALTFTPYELARDLPSAFAELE